MSGIVIDGLRWEVRERGAGRPLLLVHGFTGRGTSWEPHTTAFASSRRTMVVDLPGHGRSGVGRPDQMTVERSADDLATILERAGAVPAAVLGYSLGARLALRLAVAHPAVVEGLVLESPSAGIPDQEEREARRRADDALAARIDRDGIEAFVAAWEVQPVFATEAALPPARARHRRAIRLANRPAGLAASLRAAGQGTMEPLHDRLSTVVAPTLVVTGALDTIGRPRAERVAAGIPGAHLAVIDGAGHAPHLEQPRSFRRLVTAFLSEVPAA